MLRRIWQTLVRWFRRLFGLGTPTRRESLNPSLSPATGRQSAIEPPKLLEDTDYEFLFMQLLEGVANGWQQPRVIKFLADLRQRTTEADWVKWLRRFGDRLLAAPTPNVELAVRMIQLSDIGCGELGVVAGEIGDQMLNREDAEAIAQPTAIILEQSPTETSDILESQSISLDELTQMLQQDANLVEQMAQLLQMNSTDPQAVLEALINQANNPTPAPVLDVESAEAWFNQAIQHHQRGDLTNAIACYDQCLAIDPHAPAAWSNRGAALANSGRYEEAIASFERVLQLSPDDAVAWSNRGKALSDFGRHQEAIASFDRALELQADDPLTLNHRGIALAELGQYEEAIANFDRVLVLFPGYPEALQHRSNAIAKLGRNEGANTSD